MNGRAARFPRDESLGYSQPAPLGRTPAHRGRDDGADAETGDAARGRRPLPRHLSASPCLRVPPSALPSSLLRRRDDCA